MRCLRGLACRRRCRLAHISHLAGAMAFLIARQLPLSAIPLFAAVLTAFASARSSTEWALRFAYLAHRWTCLRCDRYLPAASCWLFCIQPEGARDKGQQH